MSDGHARDAYEDDGEEHAEHGGAEDLDGDGGQGLGGPRLQDLHAPEHVPGSERASGAVNDGEYA